MLSDLLGKGPESLFSEQEPQSLFKQFYDLRVFLVGYPYTDRLEYLVVHGNRVRRDDSSNLLTFEHSFELASRWLA